MTNIEAIKLILRTYRFEYPIPESIRSQLYLAKKKTLVNILMRYGQYTLFAKTVIETFFYFKKIGHGISLAKSAAVVITGSVLIAGALTVGSVYMVQKFVTAKEPLPATTVVTPAPAAAPVDAPKPNTAKETVPLVSYDIAVQRFTAASESAGKAQTIQNAIIARLNKNISSSAIAFGSKNYKAGKTLLGTMVSTESAITVYARILDNETSATIASVIEKINGDADIPAAGDRIADKVLPFLK